MINPLAMSISVAQLVALKFQFSFQNFLKKWQIPGLRKEPYKMNLEHRVIPDSKKAIRDSGPHMKKLPLAKKMGQFELPVGK